MRWAFFKIAHAGSFQDGLKFAKDNIANPGGIPRLNDVDFPSIIFNLLTVVLAFVAALAVALIIYGGFQYMFSRGNEKNVASAKAIIMYAVLGLIIIGLSVALVNFVIITVKGVK